MGARWELRSALPLGSAKNHNLRDQRAPTPFVWGFQAVRKTLLPHQRPPAARKDR